MFVCFVFFYEQITICGLYFINCCQLRCWPSGHLLMKHGSKKKKLETNLTLKFMPVNTSLTCTTDFL